MPDKIRAADLPIGAIVATADKAWIRVHDEHQPVKWRNTDGRWCNGWTVDKALDEGAVVLRPGGEPTRIDWAAEVVYLDGSVKHTPKVDEEFARLTADSINVHTESLNEPTRQAKGVDRAYPASREVRVLPDGTQVISPWRAADETKQAN